MVPRPTRHQEAAQQRPAWPRNADNGLAEDHRGRDRVRDRRPWNRGVEPDRGQLGPDQRVHQRTRRVGRGVADPAEGRLGLRGRGPLQRRPGDDPRRGVRSGGRDEPGQRSPAERCALLRRPRAPRVLDSRVCRPLFDRRLGQGGRAHPPPLHGGLGSALAGRPGDRRSQEQQRRQGQQLRLPRELPDGPPGPLRPHRQPDHPPLHQPSVVHRFRQGRV